MIRNYFPTRFALALTFALALAPLARAQSWTSFASGNWSNGTNWSGGVAPNPGPTTDLVFSSVLDTSYTATNDLGNPFVLRTLTLNNQAQTGAIASYIQINGNPLQFSGANAGIAVIGSGDTFLGGFGGTPTSMDLAGVTTITGTTTSGLLRITHQITGVGSLVINKPSNNLNNNGGGVNLFFSSTSAVNTYSGGTILQAGTLAIGGGIQAGTTSTAGNLGTGTLRISTTGAGLDGTGELKGQSSSATIVTVPVTIDAGATLNEKRSTLIVLGRTVTGSGAGAGVSTGTLASSYGTNAGFAFEAASNYTGPTQVTQSNIILRGTNGALTGSTQIDLFRNSVLLLDSNTVNPDTGNTAGNHTAQDRIRDDAVVGMHRADFNFTGNVSAGTTETIGTLNGDGWNIFQLTPGASATLTINNLVRVNRGTFEFRGPNTGSTATLGTAAPGTAGSANVLLGAINGGDPRAALVGSGGATGTTNQSIIPFMTSAPSEAIGGNTFLTYDPVNGLRALSTATEFATAIQAVPYAPGATNNVRLTAPQATFSQPVSVNSLLVAGANVGVYGAGGLTGRVNVTSGAIETTFASSTIANYLNVGELNFGGREAVITGNNLIVINAALTNNTGLTYSGTAARTALVSPNTVISGPVTLNGGESGFPGALVINNQAQLGGATAINFGGGALNVNPLATGSGDTLTTPINIGPGGGTINLLPVGVGPLGQGVSATSQVLTLTGALTGTGPLQLNSGTAGAAGGGGTFILAGNASGFSGQLVIAAGVAQFDADSRLGTGTTLLLGNSNLNQFAELHPTASMSTSKNVYVLGTTFVRVDAGATYTMNGFITAIGSAGFRKFGPGELVLTGENTYGGATLVGSPAIIPGLAGTASFAGTGGTLRVRDGGTLAYTSAYTIAPSSTLIADNTGTANLTNRLNNAPVNLAGGSLVLLGSQTAASTETLGPMTLAANSGSIVEVVPGATQTASMFFSGPTGGLVRNTGSTVTLRAPGLGGTTGGTGQINFIHNVPPPPGTGPALTNGILAGVFGENSAGAGAFGLVTTDTVPAVGAFPQYYRTRLLTPAEYTVNAIPDSGVVTTNHRQTAPAAPSGSPTINSLFLDAGGSLAIAPGNQVTLTSGTLLMAGGTSISGAGALAAPATTDLSVYVGAGANATLGTDVQLATAGRVLAKAGPGTLELTAAISATAPPATISVQRGTFRLGTGGSIPAASIVSVDGGATFDVNGAGGVVEVARLIGLGAVQLGSTSGTVLRVNTPSGANMIFGGTITGTGSFEKAGAGTFSFGATASFAGPITFSAGFMNIGEGVSFSPIIPVVAGGAVTMADGTDLSVINVQDFQRSIVVNVGTSTGTAILDTFSGFGTVRFSGPITIDANKTLRLNAGSTGLIRVSGQISGGGALAFGTGASGPIIEGNNTYTGGTSVLAAATIGVGSDTAFGTGAITNTAALNLFAFGGNRTVANAVNFNADITYGTINPVYQGFDLTFTGPATINANRTVTTTAAGRLTLTNVSDGGGVFSLTKAGGGTLALAGANNTYLGATAVNAGTLLVNGTLATGGGIVTVASGAVLAGGGTINRAVMINSGGTIKPGNSPGRLTIGGNVTLSATPAIYLWELGANTTSGAGTNWSQIQMTSGDLNVQLGAILVPAFVGTSTQPNGADAFWQAPQRWDNVIDLTGTSTNLSGQTSFVINNAAWSPFGLFSTIPAVAGSGIALQWTPVPEPLHVFLLCGAAGLGLRWWRGVRVTAPE